MNRRRFIQIAGAGAAAAALAGGRTFEPQARQLYIRLTRPEIGPSVLDAESAETLYNGIVLPSPWPPPRQFLDRSPSSPSYLLRPPAVIPIDVGRQLFVDDFLIEECTLDRSYHAAAYVDANPVLAPALPWETYDERPNGERPRPTAMPFSDGVWYDPTDRCFKLWYTAGYNGRLAYAESDDGLAWRKPRLDVVPGTNIVYDELRDSSTVWLDHDATTPQQRFKLLVYLVGDRRLHQLTSPDGIHWHPAGYGGASGDRTTCFFNPFRDRWVYSLRDDEASHRPIGRYRRYVESERFGSLTPWTTADTVPWVGADDLDSPRTDMRVPPELYSLDCVAYESVVLGLFTLYYGDPPARHKPNQVF